MHREPYQRSLSLRQKFWLILGAPLLAVIAMGGYVVSERYRLIITAERSIALGSAGQLTEVSEALQVERGYGFIYAHYPSQTNRQRWQQSISTTDLTLAGFSGRLNEVRQQFSDLAAPLAVVDHVAAELPGLREILANQQRSAIDNFDSYGEFIAELQLALAAFGAPLADSPLQSHFQTLVGLNRFIETSAQLRGQVAAALQDQRLATDELRRLTVVEAVRQQQLQQLISQAPPQLRRQLVARQQNTAIQKVNGILATLEHSRSAPDLDPEAWFQAASAELAEYQQLQRQVLQQLQQHSRQLLSTAWREVVITLGIVLATILFSVAASSLVINQISRGFLALRDAATDFANHGKLSPIAGTPSHDELGQVTVAFNKLVDTLNATADVAQAVASGDFTQRLPEKSHEDRLGRSINHMTQSLRESITQLTRENWLKTGLSELAATLNSNIPPDRLANTALGFIANRLEALAGAIYRCDDDGSADLLASFAGSQPRLHVCAGEGLVGQVVADGRSIYRLPPGPDYLAGRSGLGEAPAQQLAILPLPYAGQTQGVLEFGFSRSLEKHQQQFLEYASRQIGIALHAALSRNRMAELLAETQAQAQQLEVQRCELEQTNAELEIQSQQLSESRSELEAQAEQLQQTNQELAQSNTELQSRNRKVEDQSEQLRNASRYKSEFLANMSHELRTPLNALLVLTQTMIEGDADRLDEDQLESLRIVYSSGCDLLNLINDILDMSKIEAGKLRVENEPVALADIVEPLRRQFEPLARQVDLGWSVEVAENAPPLFHSDGQRLLQILRNLVSNAIKFTDNGEVSVIVSGDHNGGIEFAVHDTGAGIKPEQQTEIFKAFHQVDLHNRRHSGTGLGLTISKTLAGLLGGDITLESKPGLGSTFRLTFPAAAIKAPPSTAGSMTEKVNHEAPTRPAPVLVVLSTDSGFVHACALQAHQHGYQSRATETGAGGIDLTRKILPSAVIIDGDLPDMTCSEIVSILNDDPNLEHTQVVSVADFAQEHTEHAVGESRTVLRKPVDASTLRHFFEEMEQRLSNIETRFLVAAPDEQADSIARLLKPLGISAHLIRDEETLRTTLGENPRGCLILDPQLQTAATADLLESFASEIATHQLQVIIFSSRTLAPEEYKELCQYSSQLIQQGPGAAERLISAITRFTGKDSKELPGPRQSALQGIKLLLVDDDMRNIFALGNLLRRQGARVVLAEDGETALRHLQEQPDISVVIMDIMLPGIDGLETIRRVRQLRHYGGLPIIALTAKAMPEDRSQCLKAGANDYMAKPVDIQRLLGTIERSVSR